MSHPAAAAIVVLASYLAVGAAQAQQPSAQTPAQTQSEPVPAQAPAESKKTAEAPAPSEPSATASQKTANNSPQLTTIVVHGGPSADILRSARNAGFTIKIANGTTHFCKTQAPVGTRFVSESCMNEQQVTLWLSRAQDQRDKLQNMLGAPASSH